MQVGVNSSSFSTAKLAVRYPGLNLIFSNSTNQCRPNFTADFEMGWQEKDILENSDYKVK
jgi:hypothetical protein